MTERVERIRERSVEAVQGRAQAAQDAAQRGVEAAQDAAARGVEAAQDAADRAAAAVARVKPRLRGVIHEYSFWTAILLGVILIALANTAREVVATSVYAAGIIGLFGVSALYHRRTWGPAARAWMRRLDHSMIFVFIAASFTPFALLVLHGPLATWILIVVWGGAIAGVVLSLLWVSAPKWVSAIVYVAMGWVAVATIPQAWATLGWLSVAALGLGGALYTAGAVIYATGRPDPAPATFGYHEIFHSLVTGAAATHYLVIAFVVLPLAT